LFEAAAKLGAIISDQPTDTVEAMMLYGSHLGIAYQLIDDLLDYSGDQNEMGKTLGDDLVQGKHPLPLIHAIKQGNPEQISLIQNAIKDGGTDNLKAIHQAITETGALDYTKGRAEAHTQLALNALQSLPDSNYKKALQPLAKLALSRNT